jgi:hypothetical protein
VSNATEHELFTVARGVAEVAEAAGVTGPGIEYCRRLLAIQEEGLRGQAPGVPQIRRAPVRRASEEVRLTKKTVGELRVDAARGDRDAREQLARLDRAEAADRAAADQPPPRAA